MYTLATANITKLFSFNNVVLQNKFGFISTSALTDHQIPTLRFTGTMLFSKAAVLAFVGAASAVPSESLEARHAKGFSRHVITVCYQLSGCEVPH